LKSLNVKIILKIQKQFAKQRSIKVSSGLENYSIDEENFSVDLEKS
jgi:hypothetical protein